MEYREKEVYFNEYCKQCKFKDNPEESEPCASCLDEPFNTDSHKPIKFIKGDTKNGFKKQN